MSPQHFIIAVLVREKNQSWILRATIDSDIIDRIVRAAWIGKRRCLMTPSRLMRERSS